MVEAAIQSLPLERFACKIAVVSDAQTAAFCGKAGFSIVYNPSPKSGQGLTITLGMQAAQAVDAMLFCVADQPYLQKSSVIRLLDHYSPGSMYALSHQGKRGNPVLFPSALFAALRALKPTQTGRFVIQQHMEKLVLVEAASAKELQDIDTKEALEDLSNIKKA